MPDGDLEEIATGTASKVAVYMEEFSFSQALESILASVINHDLDAFDLFL